MRVLLVAALMALLVTPVAAQAQDSLALARDLYASANYDDALVVLSRLDSANTTPPPDRLSINQYRAFCLVALGRTSEAERAIEAVVSAEPSYHPAANEASPRLRSAFTTVRQRILPSVVQQQYNHAKAAFDRQDFAAAATEFDQMLETLGDPDLGAAATRSPLADLRMLATGFRDLSAKASTPPPAPVLAPAPAPVAALPVPSALRIYTGVEPGVSPPVIIRQEVPPFPREVAPGGFGVLDLVINELGTVESAVMRTSISPRYDNVVINATRSWKYKPAMMGGTPVKYRKFISISLKPAT